MRKATKVILISAAAILVTAAALLPVVVPPTAEHIVAAKLNEFGLRAQTVKMNLCWRWRNGPGIAGDFTLRLADSPWSVSATFGASIGEWCADITLPETQFDQSDLVITTLLARVALEGVSNLVFSGSVALDAHAERTFRKPVPVWKVRTPLRNVSASAAIDGKNYAVESLSLTPAASGIADHFDISPLYLRAKKIDAAGFELTDFSATVRASEKSLLVTEASANVCGGKVALYSLFLDPKTLSTGFTLFIDDVDTEKTLAQFRQFNGSASGKLHGKIKLFVKDGGRSLRLGDAFLYSTPGETGKLRLADATPVTDNLMLAGLDEATRANVAGALADLDYSVLRLNLRRGEGKKATLSVTLTGTATRGTMTVPVDLTLNFNGELEQLLNLGLGLSAQTKGKKK